MSATPKADRLREARVKAGFDSAGEAAERFGWGVAGYRHHENGTRDFGADAAKKYGRAFRVKAAWLMNLDNSADLPPAPANNDLLDVNGSVAAGVWLESEHWNDERRFTIKLPSPMPGAKRFGLEVEGNSMDLFYEPKSVVDCVSIYSGDVRPATGDHVIVERVRTDGLRELTVKEYREEDGRFLLVPRSTRPQYQAIEYPGPDRPGERDPTSGELVQVIAFVVTHYPPRALQLMKRMGLIAPAERPED